MKRYGKKQLEMGMRISYSCSNRIYNESPRIIDKTYGEKIGYITYDLFNELLKNRTLATTDEKVKIYLVKDFGDYWYSEYVVIIRG